MGEIYFIIPQYISIKVIKIYYVNVDRHGSTSYNDIQLNMKIVIDMYYLIIIFNKYMYH